MKIDSLPNKQIRRQGGFTLIEMIGVLAVIAILAALLIPKVFSAIAEAKINNTVVSTETIKTALADHYGKYGVFNTIGGTTNLTAPSLNYDTNVLMAESLLDKPFQTKLGTNWVIVMNNCDPAGTTVTAPLLPNLNAPAVGDASFDLDGNSSLKNETPGQFVMEAVVEGVSEADAQAISAQLDGPSLSTTTLGTSDLTGRVKYMGNGGGAVTVYIYLTHR